MLAITGTYAAILTGFFIFLSARVIIYRRGNSVSLGDAGDKVLLSRIRAQGNFSEYAPLGVLLLAVAEMQGEGALWLHLCGMLLLVGRLMHGLNFTFQLGLMPMRVGGMVLTFTALALGAVLALPF
jgi:uncharacterized protein